MVQPQRKSPTYFAHIEGIHEDRGCRGPERVNSTHKNNKAAHSHHAARDTVTSKGHHNRTKSCRNKIRNPARLHRIRICFEVLCVASFVNIIKFLRDDESFPARVSGFWLDYEMLTFSLIQEGTQKDIT